jgi:endogenous inhibitor of DNA gyrase (YacG/DUF329 family)
MPGQPIEWPEYPFCSPRCRLVDLGRWLGESYRIPSDEVHDDDSPPAEKDDQVH